MLNNHYIISWNPDIGIRHILRFKQISFKVRFFYYQNYFHLKQN